MIELIKKLEYAKEACLYLLANDDGSVDFHGLRYWAKEVERLRAKIKKML